MKQEDKELLKKKAIEVVEGLFNRAKVDVEEAIEKAKGMAVNCITTLIEENVVVSEVNQDKLISDIVETLQKNGVVDPKYFETDTAEPKAVAEPEHDGYKADVSVDDTVDSVERKEPVYNPYA